MCLQHVIERLEPIAPELLVVTKPVLGSGQRRRLEGANVRAPLDVAAQKAGPFQDAHMLGSGGKRHLKRRCQLADIAPAGGKATQHGPPRRVGQGVKDAIKGCGLL